MKNSNNMKKGIESHTVFCGANSHSVQRIRQRAISSGYLSHMFSHCACVLASIECILV